MTFTDVVDVAISSVLTKTIVFNTAIYDAARLGVFDITLSYTLNGPTYVSRVFTFTVNDPCVSAITPPAAPASYSAMVGDPNYTQNIAPSIALAQQPYCVFSIILTSVKSTTPDTSSSALTFGPLVNKLFA